MSCCPDESCMRQDKKALVRLKRPADRNLPYNLSKQVQRAAPLCNPGTWRPSQPQRGDNPLFTLFPVRCTFMACCCPLLVILALQRNALMATVT